jgi:beta-lactamase class A
MFTAERLAKALSTCGMTPAAAIVRRLDAPGEWSAGEPGDPFYPASMLKTPLAACALALVQDADLCLEQRAQVEPRNMTLNDMPSPLVPGYSASLRELIELAITRSDNVATNMLYDIVGRERAGRLCAERFGLKGTAFFRKLSGGYPLIHDAQWDGVRHNRHSAADAARMFEMIARSAVPFAQTLYQILGRQEWNNKLSLGLQPGDRFAHKTGDTDEVTHDGGILETSQGALYVVVVYTGLPSSEENNARFAPLMQALRSIM